MTPEDEERERIRKEESPAWAKRSDSGFELPKRPEIPEELEAVIGFFVELSRRRQSGMGATPLSLVEIEAFFDAYDIEKPERDFLRPLILAMDDEYIAWHCEKESKNNASSPSRH